MPVNCAKSFSYVKLSLITIFLNIVQFDINWCWFNNTRQIIMRLTYKRINNDTLFHVFFTTLSCNSLSPPSMSLRSRCNNKSLNDNSHHVLSHCNVSVYLPWKKKVLSMLRNTLCFYSCCCLVSCLVSCLVNMMGNAPEYPYLSLLWMAD